MVSSFICGVPGAIYSPGCENRGGSHCKAFDGLLMAAGSNPPPLIRLLLIPLDRSWFLVSKMVWNLKIQRSDQKLWLSKNLRCIDRYVIPVFVISQLFQVRFRPMNSRWNENWIIFGMALASTRSGSRIKIRVLGPPEINFRSNLV